MAFTRKFLTTLGIEEEKIEQIIIAHRETVDPIIAERDQFKKDSDNLKTVEKELETLKQSGEKDSYKVKYDALKDEHEKLKADIKNKEIKQTKEKAYLDLLKEVGISEKRQKSVLRCADLDSLKFDKDGNIEDVDNLKKSIADEWSDFIEKDGSKGANPPTPPTNNGGKKSKEEIMKIKDPVERQKAISENLSSFGYEE